jgi:hypothetical protein
MCFGGINKRNFEQIMDEINGNTESVKMLIVELNKA